MNEQVRRICALLKKDRPEYQCAAAVVLGELKVRDSSVIKEIGHLLENGQDRRVKGYALAALEKIGSRESIPYVLPILAGDGELREQAVRVLASLGAGVARDLAARFKHASAAERRGINLVLARVRGGDATRMLLEALQDDDEAVVEETLQGIRREMKTASPRDKRAFLAQVRSFLDSRAVKTNKRAKTAGLRALGFLDDLGAESLALSHLGPQHDQAIRHAALVALRTMPRAPRASEALLKKLLPLLSETDFTQVVAPALDVLRPMTLGKGAAKLLQDLTHSQHLDVRRFAVSKLREFDTREAVDLLGRFLEDHDATIRDLASDSLMAIPTARPVLFERLLRETHMERAWTLARILKPHGAQFSKEQVRRLGDKVTRLLDADQKLYEPSLFLLRSISEASARDALLRRALRRKRTKHFDDAARTLRLLERHGILDDDVRFELAVMLMKLSPRDPQKDARDTDPALEHLSSVVQSPKFGSFDRLRREAVLSADDLFFIGWHFVEGQGVAKDFGGKVLHLVLRKVPKSPLALRAREKLNRESIR